MEKKVRYPIGIENFKELISGGYLYVDKTEYIHTLIEQGKYFLLCRPRRFGKSLFLSTLEAFFEGKRELFDGLAITKHDYVWEPSPVIRLNLVNMNSSDPEQFTKDLSQQLGSWEAKYNVEGVDVVAQTLNGRFRKIIETAYEKTDKRVVILIDEYDKPLVSHIDNEKTKEQFRNILKPLYSNLKGCDQYIRMALLTGVSRFSRLSIFSDINNLNDISFDNKFAAICGITEQEMINNCQIGIDNLADENGMSCDEAVAALKTNYDGYHFTKNCPDIYNPFSLLSALSKKEVGNYWFATGTPTFLLKTLIANGVNLEEYFTEQESSSDALSQTDAYSSDVLPMLFQTGYLTIKGYDAETGDYLLGIPNREVGKGIYQGLLPLCAHTGNENAYRFIRECSGSLRKGNPEDFLKTLRSFLADIPYDLTCKKPEIYFENNLYVIFKVLGFNVQTEYKTSGGRIDVLVKTPKYIYVMELKLDKTAEKASRQIENKEYALPFEADGRQIFKIGVNFSSETHTISDWEIVC